MDYSNSYTEIFWRINYMIDYVTLMLVNMAAVLAALACFLIWGFSKADGRNWSSVFAIGGLVAVICGLKMTFTWPLPSPYNIMFGEMSVLLGMLFLGTALALAMGWELRPLGIYAFFASLAAVLIGIRIIGLGLTQNPSLSGTGFILTGAGGILTAAAFCFKKSALLRLAAAMLLVIASLIWVRTGFLAYWMHLLVSK